MLRAVFFDVGNTLLYPYPSVSVVVKEILQEWGHEHELAAIDGYLPLVDEYYEDRYREDDTFWTNEDEASQVWVGMYSLLCRELGIEEDAEAIARRVYDEFGDPARWQPYSDVFPALDRLEARGLKLGIISNWDTRLSRLIEGLGIAEKLHAVVSSAEVGLRKPDPRIFELACARLGLAPSECAHVGDHHYADVIGAEAVGMSPVLIDRFEGQVPPEDAHRFIRSLDDVEAILFGEADLQ
jgi:putative hydrolase of the HAD superfamily